MLLTTTLVSQHACLLCCRFPETCDKNHIRYFEDRDGYHCEMVLPHFKNDTIKGTQYLPMSQLLRIPFIQLEQAHQFLASLAPTLWFNTSGGLYKKDYWSTICSKALTLPDGRRITAKDFRCVSVVCLAAGTVHPDLACLPWPHCRHLFATAWRDFINCPSTQLTNFTIHELDAAAADLMCSSTYSFNAAYDNTNRVRGNKVIMAHWDKFMAYVKDQHELQQSTSDWDPLMMDLSYLSLNTDFSQFTDTT